MSLRPSIRPSVTPFNNKIGKKYIQKCERKGDKQYGVGLLH